MRRRKRNHQEYKIKQQQTRDRTTNRHTHRPINRDRQTDGRRDIREGSYMAFLQGCVLVFFIEKVDKGKHLHSIYKFKYVKYSLIKIKLKLTR